MRASSFSLHRSGAVRIVIWVGHTALADGAAIADATDDIPTAVVVRRALRGWQSHQERWTAESAPGCFDFTPVDPGDDNSAKPQDSPES